MIKYSDSKIIEPSQLEKLYLENKWYLYTKDIPKLVRAVENSLYVKTAWVGTELVGLIRVVGDGESILYIQDILVLPEYHRKGIGTKLMKDVLDKYKDCRQKALLTGLDEKQSKFYRSLGFITPDEMECAAFVRRDI